MTTAADQAYGRIRQRILRGDYGPGEHLKEERLAAEVGVSRTPVREALRRLEADRLVTFVANRGAYVATWSMDDIEEIFTLRAMFEGHAAFRAATRMTPTVLDELSHLVELIDHQMPGDTEEKRVAILDVNQRFHQCIVQTANSERLNLALGRLMEVPLILRTLERYSPRDIERSNQHHRELVEAFRAGDALWAQHVMETHLRVAYRSYREGEPKSSTLGLPQLVVGG